jgi:hypothetical protein
VTTIELSLEDYDGLDSDRDTEDEVETAIRFFPEILSRRKQEGYWHEEEQEWEEGFYPIQYLVCSQCDHGTNSFNLKAVSFVPLVARLSKEFGQFTEEERGGLFIDGRYGTYCIFFLTKTNFDGIYDREHHESIDDKCLLVLKQLRDMGLLKKEDVQRQTLLTWLCMQSIFAEKRFRFLAEWYPTLLIDTPYEPLIYAACRSTIQGFRVVFEYGILYYPNKKGISMLFKKYEVNHSTPYNVATPFNVACDRHGRDIVMNVIEETLLDFHRRSDDDNNNNNNNNTGPYNVVDIFITAAINENIHLW